MAVTNRYASGRAWESVGYTTNGEADDWGWGAEGAVSLTIEVGGTHAVVPRTSRPTATVDDPTQRLVCAMRGSFPDARPAVGGQLARFR